MMLGKLGRKAGGRAQCRQADFGRAFRKFGSLQDTSRRGSVGKQGLAQG
jgi:hypothetical protein